MEKKSIHTNGNYRIIFESEKVKADKLFCTLLEVSNLFQLESICAYTQQQIL